MELNVKAGGFSVHDLINNSESDYENFRRKLRQEGKMCSRFGECFDGHHASVQTVYDSARKKAISVELCQDDLWGSFHRLGTEMIITKTGRRMFPALRYKVDGLDTEADYRVFIDIIPADKNKYRYIYHSSRWMVAGAGDFPPQTQNCEYSESNVKGSFIEKQVLSFEKLKLTNSCTTKSTQISLTSMQLYQPRLHIEKIPNGDSSNEYYVTTFPQTCFMAVTAYQNQGITKMKIARNPFAKGFREACKRRTSLEDLYCKIKSGNDSRPRKRSVVTKKIETEGFSEGSRPQKRLSGFKELSDAPQTVHTSERESTVPIPIPIPIVPVCGYAFANRYLCESQSQSPVPLQFEVIHNMTLTLPNMQLRRHPSSGDQLHVFGISPSIDATKRDWDSRSNEVVPFYEHHYQSYNR